MIYLKFLLEKGANVNQLDDNNENILMQLVNCWNGFKGYDKIIRQVIAQTDNMNLTNTDGETAFFKLNTSGEDNNQKVENILNLLLENGADPAIFKEENPIISAISREDTGLAKKLISMNVPVSDNMVSYQEHCSVLHMAVDSGDDVLVEQLLEKGLEVNIEDHNNDTSLILAASEESPKIIKALIAKGAYIEHKNDSMETALLTACRYNNHASVAELLAHNANVSHRNKKDEDAFLIASKNGNTKILKLLLDAGHDINSANNKGITALMLAAQNNHCDAIGFLLKHGADSAIKTKTGWTAQRYAKGRKNNLALDLLENRIKKI